MLGKLLVISPHKDDETLGCGGLLSKTESDLIHIRYYNTYHPLVDQSLYDAEANQVAKTLDCWTSEAPFKRVNELDQFPISWHIHDIEQAINDWEPDTLLLPFPDYNQDHRHLFNASITASRIHDKNFRVKSVLAYEQPSTLQTNRFEPQFIPHLFIPIDIEKKLALYRIYQSQQRGHRTEDMVKSLAAIRGMQCGVPYAEAFMIVRMTA